MSFSTRRDIERPLEPPRPLEQTANASPPVTCVLCGSANQRGLRFCITCGHQLTPGDGGSRIGAIELMRTVVDPPTPDATATEAPPIAPARVIDVVAAERRSDQRLCPRCRGVCELASQFCRFCGLSLGGAPAPSPVATASAAPPPLATRVSSAQASLVLITSDGVEGRSYVLGASTDLGRVEGHILFPDDQYISPRHARIAARGGEYSVRDLDSANGVFMRIPFEALSVDEEWDGREDKITMRGHHEGGAPISEPRSEQPITDQELFLVGQQVLRFEVVKQAEEAFGAASENGTLLFGTPATPRYARLSQRTVEGMVRDVFHVRRAETVIGRESGDIVFTDDPFLSRRHAVLRMHGVGGQRRFTLADLGSSNGTFVRIRDEVHLFQGAQFRIGQQLLRFDIDAAHTGV